LDSSRGGASVFAREGANVEGWGSAIRGDNGLPDPADTWDIEILFPEVAQEVFFRGKERGRGVKSDALFRFC